MGSRYDAARGTRIGEFSIHKEFVSAKIAGETASLTNPALDRILDFAGEVGLASGASFTPPSGRPLAMPRSAAPRIARSSSNS
jgi:hypothetical protein